MEITVDVGSDVIDKIEDIAQRKGKSKESIAAEMLSIGAQVLLNSLEEKQDNITSLLLENSVRANELLIEILSSVFNREKSRLGVYDAETAVALIERIVEAYLKGHKTGQ